MTWLLIGGTMVEMKLTRIVKFILNISVLIGFVSFNQLVFAEPAPVYDADSLEQPYDNNGGMQQDLPPPPNQSPDTAFIPIQSEVQPVSSAGHHNSHGGMERRLQRVEQQINNMQASDVSAQLESLQNQIQSLRAEIEQITKAMRDTQNQEKSIFADFDSRLTQLAAETSAKFKNTNMVASAAPKVAPKKPAIVAVPQSQSDASSATMKVAANTNSNINPNTNLNANPNNGTVISNETEGVGQPDVAAEQQIYQKAYNMIKNKKYNDAVNILQSMLQKYPAGQFASNAHYWLGELFGLMGQNDKALNEFNEVVRNFSDSPRVSDAMLKVGLIFAAQSRWVDAKAMFKAVMNRFPGTASSRLANEQLKQIKQAGH